MKSTVKAVVLLTLSFALFGAVLAHAQNPPLPTFQHVIVVIQENRTPDNLFTGIPVQTGQGPYFEPGVDLAPPAQPQTPASWCLGACFDPDHGSAAWQAQYGGGSYNACPTTGQGVSLIYCNNSTCNGQKVCSGSGCTAGAQYTVPSCPQSTYVNYTYDEGQPHDNGFEGDPPLLPYVSIATQYGFANYFYQTNQGPSQPAHDFLFGGTSAPAGSNAPGVWYGNLYQEFAAGNPGGKSQSPGNTDCDYTNEKTVTLILPTGQPDQNNVPFPCFDHQTLADLLDNAKPPLTWKYYTNEYYGIWTAPSGIAHFCEPDWMTLQNPFPFACDTYSGGDLYTQNVVVPPRNVFRRCRYRRHQPARRRRARVLPTAKRDLGDPERVLVRPCGNEGGCNIRLNRLRFGARLGSCLD